LWFAFADLGRASSGKGVLFPILQKGLDVQITIVLQLPNKEPRSPQHNVTSIYGNDITPELILVILTNGKGNQAP